LSSKEEVMSRSERVGDRADMSNEGLARGWMTLAGVLLIGAGLLGFISGNPIASESPDALFRVNAAHNIVHLLTGAIALWIGLGTRGVDTANWTIGFGVLYALVTVLLLVDPTMFGLFADAPSNTADHVLHAALALVSLALGYMARGRTVGAERERLARN
jgi:uncharacterized membrane protein HdeD (DUF308 family)